MAPHGMAIGATLPRLEGGGVPFEGLASESAERALAVLDQPHAGEEEVDEDREANPEDAEDNARRVVSHGADDERHDEVPGRHRSEEVRERADEGLGREARQA